MKKYNNDKGQLVSYLKNLFLTMTLLAVSQIVLHYLEKHEFKIYNTENIKNIIANEGVDIDLICTTSSCKYISIQDRIYVKRGQKVEYTKEEITGVDIAIKIPESDIIVHIDRSRFYNFLYIEYSLIFVMVLAMFTLFHMKMNLTTVRNSKLELFVDKFKLESKLQNVISESAHHEMLTPISGISTSFKEIDTYINALNLNSISNDRSSIHGNDYSKCWGTEDVEAAIGFSKVYSKYSDIIFSSLERLESVLFQMADTKHVKRSKEVKNLYELLVTTAETLKVYHITSNFKYTIHNEEMFKMFVVDKIDKPAFMNIINNQIKNAIEANANHLVFACRKSKKRNTINIIITDNGSGILGVKGGGDLNEIFKLGFSTKDKDGNIILKDNDVSGLNLWGKLLYYINDYMFGTTTIDMQSDSNRGIGLFVSKVILENVGGGIKVLNTSNLGTSFLITVPVVVYGETDD